jgi:hypothetical protein
VITSWKRVLRNTMNESRWTLPSGQGRSPTRLSIPPLPPALLALHQLPVVIGVMHSQPIATQSAAVNLNTLCKAVLGVNLVGVLPFEGFYIWISGTDQVLTPYPCRCRGFSSGRSFQHLPHMFLSHIPAVDDFRNDRRFQE